MPRLRRVDSSEPGITRRGRGRGFEYFDAATGEKITDPEVLARIKSLAVPPAWRDVWICPLADGHLQAVGTDAAGRRQYRYHDEWRARRDREKFDRMLAFARALPDLRARCAHTLAASDEPSRERVLACAVRLLDHGFFRIGTEAYAAENDTYGLATMRKRHVKLLDGALEFDYPGKGDKRRIQHVVDPQVYELVARLKARRGGSDELLAYKERRRWVDVRSVDINDFVKAGLGEEFSAKYFRTWNATVLAAVALAVSERAAGSPTGRKRASVRACKEVAHYLGNTPAVARDSYIDPRVFERYESGRTVAGALQELGDGDPGHPAIQGVVEDAVLELLDGEGAEKPSRPLAC